MFLTLRPLGRGRFVASVGGRALCESRTPFFDAARILLNEGVSPNEILTASHEGSPVVSMRSTIGKAAGLNVIEKGDRSPRIAPYTPHPSQNAIYHDTGRAHTAISGQDNGFPIPREMSLPEHAFADDHARS